MDHYCTVGAIDAVAGWGSRAIVLTVALWAVLAAVAWVLAPPDRRWTFFWVTLSILGPFGVLGAAVASPRELEPQGRLPAPVAPGRRRFSCARCTATTDLIITDPSEDISCWRCGDRRLVATNG